MTPEEPTAWLKDYLEYQEALVSILLLGKIEVVSSSLLLGKIEVPPPLQRSAAP